MWLDVLSLVTRRGGTTRTTDLLAFMAVLFMFMLHRTTAKRLTFWTCVAVVCMVWTLSVAMAFPPVFDVGSSRFVREEDRCIFQHRCFKANDTLGFMLMLAVLILATHVVYMKLLLFENKHRKMKPVQMVGPELDLPRARPMPRPPPLPVVTPHRGAFVKACTVPHRYHAGVNPVVCFLLDQDLKTGLLSHVPACCRTTPQLHPRQAAAALGSGHSGACIVFP